jgi:hypothetical protein
MVPIFVISSLSSIAHTILFSNSSKNVSPDNMSINPESPTGKIMLLSASVIRQKRPDLRRGIRIRIATKTLRNALNNQPETRLCWRKSSPGLTFLRGSCTGPLFASPATSFFQLLGCLRPQDLQSRGCPFLCSRARSQAGGASLLPLHTFSFSKNPLKKPAKWRAQKFWQQFERERFFAKGLGSLFTHDLEVTKPPVLEPPLVNGLSGLFCMRDIDESERKS